MATRADPILMFAVPARPDVVAQVADRPVMLRPGTTTIDEVTAMVNVSAPVDALITPEAVVVTPQITKVPLKLAVTPPCAPGEVQEGARPAMEEVGASQTVAEAEASVMPGASTSDETEPVIDQLFDER